MLEDEISTLLMEHDQGVHWFKSNGDLYWLKIAGEEKNSFFLRLSNICQKIFHFDFLKTNATGMSPQLRLEHEKKVISYLSNKLQVVPDIVCEGEGFFVTRDLGLPLNEAPREIFSRQFLQSLFMHLMDIHKHGVAHGRPSMRDIVVSQNRQLTFIDFEESAVKPSPSVMARDFIFMILDLERINLGKELKKEAIKFWLKHEDHTIVKAFIKQTWFLRKSSYLARLVLLFKPSNRLSRQIVQTSEAIKDALK